MEKITIGSKTYEISKQAKIVLYSWIVILFSMFIILLVDQQNIGMKLMVFVMYILLSLLGVYSVNCYVVGQCNILAWVGATVSVVSAVLYVLTTVLMLSVKMPMKVSKK